MKSFPLVVRHARGTKTIEYRLSVMHRDRKGLRVSQ